MGKEPVRYENDDSKNTELPDGASCENGDDTQNGIIGYHFEGVGGARMAEPLCNALFDGECDGGPSNRINLHKRNERR